MLEDFLGRPQPRGPNNAKFTFIDLFAGIGGLRLAFESNGGKCVFTSEWDRYAQRTYTWNHGNSNSEIHGDIREIVIGGDPRVEQQQIEKVIPKHDILVAGFPCQPFSLAGVSKKNSLGMPHGFLDKTQGTLFHDLARVIEVRRPKAFMLENVKNLVSHNGGDTFGTILEVIKGLGYSCSYKVIDARAWLPQHRERIVIVGFRDPNLKFDFGRVEAASQNVHQLRQVLHGPLIEGEDLSHDFGRYYNRNLARPQDKYTLTPKLWTYLQDYKKKHAGLNNGFGFSLFSPDDVSRTLSARYYKDGSEILIRQDHTEIPRRLTPRECARLMGFDDSFRIPVSDSRAYKQFGNSVAVPVFSAVAREVKEYLPEVRD